ncbi:hypothetical protein RJ55_02083 [Drechmeria coniospora]|nr:hypothetical protein RJ55_02083 [Drechmeria coniospora]
MRIDRHVILSMLAVGGLTSPLASTDASPSEASSDCRSDCVGDVVSVHVFEDRGWFFGTAKDCKVDKVAYEVFQSTVTAKKAMHMMMHWSWLACGRVELEKPVPPEVLLRTCLLRDWHRAPPRQTTAEAAQQARTISSTPAGPRGRPRHRQECRPQEGSGANGATTATAHNISPRTKDQERDGAMEDRRDHATLAQQVGGNLLRGAVDDIPR